MIKKHNNLLQDFDNYRITQLSNILVFVLSDLFFSSQLCFLPPHDLSQTANSRGTIAMDEVDDETEMQGDDIEIGLSIK